MAARDELLRLIGNAEQYIRSETPSAALPHLHKVFFYSTESPEVRATACLKIAKVCRSTGQPFIGAEFLREANNIVSAPPPSMRTLSSEVANAVRLFAEDPDDIVERSYSDLIFAVTSIWHRNGIPFLPSKDSFLLANVHRVDEPYPFFSNISWMCRLPFQQPGAAEPPFNLLLTAFDTNLGAHVVQRFERTVATLQAGADSSSELIAAVELPALAITLRVPKSEVPALEQIRNYFSTNGVPIELLEGATSSRDGNDYVREGLDAASKGADLFSIAFMREASTLFESALDRRGQRMARLNEALAMQRLGQDSGAVAVAFSVYTDAKRANDVEIAEAIRASFPAMFETGRDGDAVLDDLDADLGDAILTVQDDRPFVLDESSKKVIGAKFASEASAEFESSKVLNEAWTLEFPGIPAPFSTIHSTKSFEWNDPSFLSETPTGQMDLGQLMRLMPLDGTLRLADAEALEVPAGYTSEGYATEFVSTVMLAILVAHKRLGGAYSSETGTSISAGNVSTRGHVFDYETFRSPTLGDEGDLGLAQIQDLCNAVYLIHTFLQKLGRPDLMAEMMEKCALTYEGKEKIDLQHMEHIKQIARVGVHIQQNRALVNEFARTLHANAVWRT